MQAPRPWPSPGPSCPGTPATQHHARPRTRPPRPRDGRARGSDGARCCKRRTGSHPSRRPSARLEHDRRSPSWPTPKVNDRNHRPPPEPGAAHESGVRQPGASGIETSDRNGPSGGANCRRHGHDSANIKDRTPPPNHPNKPITHKTNCDALAPREKGNLTNWKIAPSERIPVQYGNNPQANLRQLCWEGRAIAPVNGPRTVNAVAAKFWLWRQSEDDCRVNTQRVRALKATAKAKRM